MKNYSILLFFLFGFSFNLIGQEYKLAQQYYNDGEFEKAATLYKKLYDKQKNNEYYFGRYVNCLIYLESLDQAEKDLKSILKEKSKSVNWYVVLGNIYELQFKQEKAEKQYVLALEKLPKERHQVIRLAQEFVRITKYDWAVKTYSKGAELLKDKNIFAYYEADLQRRMGNTKEMITAYLNAIEYQENRMSSIQTIFQRFFSDSDYQELQSQLYQRVQSNTDIYAFNEMLAWVFIQRKDYRNALRQMIAIDKRNEEDGARVFNIGQVAAEDADWEVASKAFEYIVTEKSQFSPYFFDAQKYNLYSKRKKIEANPNYSKEEIETLVGQYYEFLNKLGFNARTIYIITELAELEALYLNDLPKAIQTLNSLLELQGLNPQAEAEAKLSLADYYLMSGEIWESTLLYSQVDKDFGQGILGHEARFRNARLSYFNGDFTWAQAQFDVLKNSTSKLISNNALDLSVFIMDNLGLDTTEQSLKLFADAEMLIFQNRYEDANTSFDQLLQQFPAHSLQDDVLYFKAGMLEKQQEFAAAAAIYEKIIADHIEEIRADNAMYKLAELYENKLNDLEKAKGLYERLFLEFTGSVFALEAREKYRALRGDNI
ncbi:MAG: tetratricopeptide repeat protein [Saprospiraceae bacterium]|nr:tetratricopeptide repeat protein [Saprospiraceae bacterium]